MLVGNHEDLDRVGSDLKFMFYLVAGFTSVLFLLVLICEYNYVFVITDSN